MKIEFKNVKIWLKKSYNINVKINLRFVYLIEVSLGKKII